jgi:DUF1680 family protein
MIRSFSFSRRNFLTRALATCATLASRRSLSKMVAVPSAFSTAPARYLKVADALSFCGPGDVTIGGWLGNKIDLCIGNRVMAQDISAVVQPFQKQSDTDNGWRGEFWGKWFTSAVLAYSYQPTPSHRTVIDEAVRALLATQSSSGDINSYNAAHHLGNWDVWTRKYVLLGLIAYYDRTGSIDALEAAKREGNTLLRDFGPGKANLPDASLNLVAGLSSSSVLEPICLLYQRTGEAKYLQFANYVVASWEAPSQAAPHGMRLLEDALHETAPTEMIAPKAYEMMSCFEGVCELYRGTGERRYLEAAIQFAQTIRRTELMVNGSGSNQELWCRGAITQTAVLEQPQETCVTATWIKLCSQLLRLTGDPSWADEIEISLYNALGGAQTPEGNWWAYFSPLIGQRVPSLAQYSDIGLSCCVANGPRALLLAPLVAVMRSTHGATVNLYAQGSARLLLPDGESVMVVQETDYPRMPEVRLYVKSGSARPFSLSLRIPAWSKRTTLTVNGEAIAAAPGHYATITRRWLPSDLVVLTLDLRGRTVQAPASKDQLAVMRGPILLALDNRLTPPEVEDVWLSTDADGYVVLKPASREVEGIWMAFDVPFEVRPYHFFKHHPVALTMCDYASAGNRWTADNLYRTWLPQPMYLADIYGSDTWKLMYPDEVSRPQIPSMPSVK